MNDQDKKLYKNRGRLFGLVVDKTLLGDIYFQFQGKIKKDIESGDTESALKDLAIINEARTLLQLETFHSLEEYKTKTGGAIESAINFI